MSDTCRGQAYLSVAEIRELLGWPATKNRTLAARRWLKRSGILLTVGRRLVVARDELGEHFPHLAIRLAMLEAEEGQNGAPGK